MKTHSSLKFVKLSKKIVVYSLVIGLVLPICIIMISSNLNYNITWKYYLKDKIGGTDCLNSIPSDAEIFASNDNGKSNFFSINKKPDSKDFLTSINLNGGKFYAIVPSSPSRVNYGPLEIAQKNPCLTGYDFFDIFGNGINHWVFQIDSNPRTITNIVTYVSTFAVLTFELTEINHLFSETLAKIKEKSFPSKLLRRLAKSNRPSTSSTNPDYDSYSKDDWSEFRQQTLTPDFKLDLFNVQPKRFCVQVWQK